MLCANIPTPTQESPTKLKVRTLVVSQGGTLTHEVVTVEELDGNCTVKQLKQILAEKQNLTPRVHIRLHFWGKELADEQCLSFYHIKETSILDMYQKSQPFLEASSEPVVRLLIKSFKNDHPMIISEGLEQGTKVVDVKRLILKQMKDECHAEALKPDVSVLSGDGKTVLGMFQPGDPLKIISSGGKKGMIQVGLRGGSNSLEGLVNEVEVQEVIFPLEHMFLFHSGRALHNEETLEECRLVTGDQLLLEKIDKVALEAEARIAAENRLKAANKKKKGGKKK